MPSPDAPFQLDVYGPDFSWKQGISGYDSVTFDPKANDVGLGTITVPDDHPTNEFLAADGARITCVYRSSGLLMSGPVYEDSGDFTEHGSITYSVEDDYRVIRDALAWVVPVTAYNSTGALQPASLSDDGQAVSTVAHTAGTDAGYGAYVFDSGTRTAETAVKELLQRNLVQRLNVPLTILPDQQRGGDAFTAGQLPVLRMDTIADGIQALLKWSGLRLMIWQDRLGSGLKADVYAGQPWPTLLTVDSGIVIPTGARWTRSRPKASRAVVAGPGDGTARAYRGVTNAAVEASTGQIREVLRDASSVPTNWDASVGTAYRVEKYFRVQSNAAADIAAFDQAMQLAGTQALADGAATASLSLQLAETATFHFAGSDGIQIGDPVQVSKHPTGTPVFADRVSGASLSHTPEAGLTVAPLVGDRASTADDPDLSLQQGILDQMKAARRRAASR